MTRERVSRLCVLVLIVLVCPWAVQGEEARNLSPGLPILMEDAYAIEHRAMELRAGLRYALNDDGDDALAVVPEFAIGALPQLEVRGRLYLGDTRVDEFENLDLQVGALYSFNAESGNLPAFAAGADIRLPTGDDSEGVDLALKGIASKALEAHRLHANLGLTFVGDPGHHKRSHRWLGGVGYDLPLSDQVLLVADVAGFSSVKKGEKTVYLLEVGARMQLDERSVVSGALGGGFGGSHEAPDLTITIGYQRRF